MTGHGKSVLKANISNNEQQQKSHYDTNGRITSAARYQSTRTLGNWTTKYITSEHGSDFWSPCFGLPSLKHFVIITEVVTLASSTSALQSYS